MVDLHGMGGVGKTTVSRAIYNKMLGDFCGKVSLVELGGTNIVELLKTVLCKLTEVSSAILENDHGRVRSSDMPVASNAFKSQDI